MASILEARWAAHWEIGVGGVPSGVHTPSSGSPRWESLGMCPEPQTFEVDVPKLQDRRIDYHVRASSNQVFDASLRRPSNRLPRICV